MTWSNMGHAWYFFGKLKKTRQLDKIHTALLHPYIPGLSPLQFSWHAFAPALHSRNPGNCRGRHEWMYGIVRVLHIFKILGVLQPR